PSRISCRRRTDTTRRRTASSRARIGMVRRRARSRSRSRSRIERPRTRTRTRTSTDGGRPLRVVPFYLALLHEARRERRARRDRRRGGLHLHEREGLIGPLLGVPGDGGALL